MAESNEQADAAVELAPEPTVSIVIATRQPAAQLVELLRSVSARCDDRAAQLIVVGAEESQLDALRDGFPTVVFADAPASAGTAELRFLGTAAASGDIIILSDDTRPLPEEWLTTHV